MTVTSPTPTPAWPKVSVLVHPDGHGEVTVNGTSHPVVADDVDEARTAVLASVATTATSIGRPVRVEAVDPTGTWQLVVHPDGRVEPVPGAATARRSPWRRRSAVPRPAPPTTAASVTATVKEPEAPAPAAPGDTSEREEEEPSWWPDLDGLADEPPAAAVPVDEPDDADAVPAAPLTRPEPPPAPARAVRRAPPAPPVETADAAGPPVSWNADMLLGNRTPPPAPATSGWQGWLHRLSGGRVSPAPSGRETADREVLADVRLSFSGPRTIVVVSPKGGASKTSTTALLAGTFGVARGGAVLAWDNNETRGTLGLRSHRAARPRPRTVWDLLGDLDRFERPDARVGDLGAYVRHQDAARFDVLASDEDPGRMAQIGATEFGSLSQVLSRFYTHLIVDTGNNVRAGNWQAAVDAADLLVVTTTWQTDVVYSAGWVLDHLESQGRSDLVASAVTVVSAASSGKVDPDTRRLVREHFGARTGAVVEVPFDPAIASGEVLDVHALFPASRRAWLQAAAAVARRLADDDHPAR